MHPVVEKPAPKIPFAQHTILTEEHRNLLENLKFKHRLNYSDTIKLGIELVAAQYSPEMRNPGVHQEA